MDIPTSVVTKGMETLAKWLAERKIKGKKIKIIANSTIYQSPGQVEPTIVSEVLEGRVEEVVTDPPGFALKDSIRYLRTETTIITTLAIAGADKNVHDSKSIPIIRASPPEHLQSVVQLFSSVERIEFLNGKKSR